MNTPVLFPVELQRRSWNLSRLLCLIGGLGVIVSVFLPWAYKADALDDMTYYGSPSVPSPAPSLMVSEPSAI